MNIAQAKAIPMQNILEKQGFTPAFSRKGGRELWYLSPLRNERTPSFSVDINENIWSDLGEAGKEGQRCAGGTIIDYLIAFYNTDAKGALHELNALYGDASISRPKRRKTNKSAPKTENPLKLISVQPLFSSALFLYLADRKISKEIAQSYLKQVHYKNSETGKKGFALGFENRIGGYEIRNKFFKGLVGKRDIAIIKGRKNTTHVQIVEGYFDFLSLLEIYNKPKPESDVIILNGSAMIGVAIEHIRQQNYKHVQTWFDNDHGGEQANIQLKTEFENSTLSIQTQNHKYHSYNDVNDMLIDLSPTL